MVRMRLELELLWQTLTTPQRRSSDGAVSASGMFKAAFPWATHVEEQAEKEYVKELTAAATDEVAGNVWISEHLGRYNLSHLQPFTYLMNASY